MTPIFLKVCSVDGVLTVYPVKGQSMVVNGKTTNIDDSKVVTMRDNYDFLLDGVIMATDTLTLKSKGWYVAGSKCFQIADELGIILDTFVNDEHRTCAEQYRDFSTGTTSVMDEAYDAMVPKAIKKTLMEKMRHDKTLKPPTIEDDGWYVDTDLWYHLMRQQIKKKQTLLVGASGTGKTELVQLMAGKARKQLEIFDMAVANPYKTFCGNLRADGGNTWFQLARYANVVQEPCWVLKDELSRAVPTANNIFLPVLDNRRTLYIEEAIAEEDQQIPVHEDCVFWATANIGAEFIGTNMLDHALLNRFQQVGLEYPPAEKESLVLQYRKGISKKDADALVSVASAIRKSDILSKDISTRQLLEVAEMVEDGYDKVAAFKWSILQQFEGNEHDGGERAAVLAIIQSH